MTPPPSTALQVAFTAAGLRRSASPMPCDRRLLSRVPRGMTEESRSRRLGDIGSNAPSKWEWGDAASVPHLVVMFFAEPGRLEAFMQKTKGRAWEEAFEALRWLGHGRSRRRRAVRLRRRHQPAADRLGHEQRDPTRPARSITATSSRSANSCSAILTSTANTPTAVARPRCGEPPDCSPAEDAPEKKDLGRNGTYLVMRQLRQDVRGFWQFINRQTGGHPRRLRNLPRRSSDARERAIRWCRFRNSRSLASDRTPNKFARINSRSMRIRRASRCPFGAHVRRANPRNTDYPGRPTGLAKLVTMLGFGPRGFRDDLMSSVRFHRILRRGREYGPELLTRTTRSRRRRRTIPSADCTSSASTRTSRVSSSSCRTPG